MKDIHRTEPEAHGSPHQVGRGVAWLGVALGTLAVAAIVGRRRAATHGGGRRIRDVMIDDVLTVDASATLMEAARTMRNANVGVLPVVVGEDRTLRGLITDRDLVVRAVAEAADPVTARVRDFATLDLVCARPDSPIDEALEVMRECRIGRLPVVDYDNKVIGIVTLSSLAFRSRDRDEALHTAEEVSRRSARIGA